MSQIAIPMVFTAIIPLTGHTFQAPADQTLLQSAEQANTPGFKIDSSCRNGTCRTCIWQLLKGEVAYRIEWPGLSADEKRESSILPCVAYPVSDVVIQLIT